MVSVSATWIAKPDIDDRLRRDDEALARLGRSLAQSRLFIGEALDCLFETGGHHDLGFSSIDGFGFERCGRSKRWCAESRRVAERIRKRGLKQIRAAIVSGQLSWSMAELLVRKATAEDEGELLEAAKDKTVREVRRWLCSSEERKKAEEEPVRAVRSVGQGEKLFFEATRMGIGRVTGGRPGDEATLTALLGEAETVLHPLAKAGRRVALPGLSPETFKKLERPVTVETPAPKEPIVAVADDPPLPSTPNEIDGHLRAVVRELASRDLEIGRLAQRMVLGSGWQRLGYESRKRYAEDRVGMSMSSLEHRATLARRAKASPVLREALLSGEIGYEAAMQIGRIENAGPKIVAKWVRRAKRRTVLALRQEVNAVLLETSLNPAASKAPPSEEEMKQHEALERKIVSGELFRSLLDGKLDPQMSVTIHGGTGCQIRLTVPAELKTHFDYVETLFHQVAGPHASFVAFMCFCFWRAWLPVFDHAEDANWEEVYKRDRYRCSNPVCDRSDITPHHLRFRAHGGGDEAENMATLCSWCHLHGIHEGRISASPPASSIRWKLGRKPIMQIDGRDVVSR